MSWYIIDVLLNKDWSERDVDEDCSDVSVPSGERRYSGS